MTRLSLLLAGAATLIALSAAEARDGCGQGWFYNGVSCAQEEGQPHRYYNDGPVYAPQRQYYREPRSYLPPPSPYNRPRPVMGANGQISCNNPNFTWQDGACKPYRGR